MATSYSRDEEVQATNDDAAASKRLAVQLGYWKDPYIQFFAKPCHRKPPELNRGYYARIKGIQCLVEQFLKLTEGKCQVVNLGAGYDSLFWNICDQGESPVKWIELDFQPVVSHKVRIIRSSKPLFEKLKFSDGESDGIEKDAKPQYSELHSSVYHLVPCDLRDVKSVEGALKKCVASFSLPSLFVCECVLVYMDAGSSSSLIRYVADRFQQAVFVNYEQVNMEDRFGEVMKENLMARGCALVGVEHCKSIQSHFDRFERNGWEGVDGGDMLQIYQSLPQPDIQRCVPLQRTIARRRGFNLFCPPIRVEKLEFLDDREMLVQLFTHYCIVWAYKNLKKDSDEKGVDLSKVSLFIRR